VVTRAQRWMLFEVQMALLSRSFIRKRAISAATAFLVSMASLALGQHPVTISRAPLVAAAQRNFGWRQASAEALSPRAEGTPAQLCNWRLQAVKTTVRSAPLPPLG
jgi:hypothetical protein